MRFCSVSVRGTNYFMTELLSMISAEISRAGQEVDFAFDAFPLLDEHTVYLVIPHEFHGHLERQSFPDAAQCARTIAVCTENPGTEWFEASCHLLPHFGRVVALNRGAVDELRRRGIDCEHLQLGYSPLWDQWRRADHVQRPVDVLYLGSTDARRNALLAGTGHDLWARRCQYLVPPLDARGVPRLDYLTGVDKHHRLSSAQLILNLHRDRSACLEWVRFLEAAVNGCVFVTEPSLDDDPLVPGEHMVVAAAPNLAAVADQLLNDPERLDRLRLGAYDFVREQLPMGPAVERIVALGSDLTRRSVRSRSPGSTPLPPKPTPGSLAGRADTHGTEVGGAAVRALSIQTRELRRAVDSLAFRIRTGREAVPEILAQTPAYAGAEPQVSVVVTVHDYESEVTDALASVAASRFSALEVVVVDDASSDGSADAVTAFMAAHPWLAATLVRHPVNLGLGSARNAGVHRARGAYVFILDADNGVYPTAIEELVAALDADTEASFAYAMIAVFEGSQPVSLLSSLPWEPARLRRGNYIDAMAMIRRDDLLAAGGYTTLPRLTGWEDFHLWCRYAETGRRGVLVPQVLAWYRRHGHSMLAETESSTVAAWSIMRARFPDLLGDGSQVAAGGPV